uniref:Uncharacterized protein n=1 Tax=Salix viminalis TaxID=40686 RepID=A0A6N2KYX1_SALVM
MGRSPCCEKAHNNKGAWTRDEDERFVAYIQAHGEGCWRSLPKSTGLLHCGKSCHLRWINYLRPDLKRGNFTCGDCVKEKRCRDEGEKGDVRDD